jgi:hypothetical protein
MKRQHDDYLDGKLTVTHEALMALAKAKMDYLKLKGKWGTKSPNNEKIVAMVAEITALKGQLKLDPKLSAIAEEGKKKRTSITTKRYQSMREFWRTMKQSKH